MSKFSAKKFMSNCLNGKKRKGAFSCSVRKIIMATVLMLTVILGEAVTCCAANKNYYFYNYTDLELSDSEVYAIIATANKKKCNVIIDDNMESLKEHLGELAKLELKGTTYVCAYLIDEQQQWSFYFKNGCYDLSSADCLEIVSIDCNAILRNIPNTVTTDTVSDFAFYWFALIFPGIFIIGMIIKAICC